MRIIIKQCRVGTSLLQSAQRQKQKGQRQGVRKAALLNALLDLISFWSLATPSEAKYNCKLSQACHPVCHCNGSILALTNLLDFTVALKTFCSARTAKARVSVSSITKVPERPICCAFWYFFHFSTPHKRAHLTLSMGTMSQNLSWYNFWSML